MSTVAAKVGAELRELAVWMLRRTTCSESDAQLLRFAADMLEVRGCDLAPMVQRLVEGKLPPPVAVWVAAHMGACSACAGMPQVFEELRSSLRAKR